MKRFPAATAVALLLVSLLCACADNAQTVIETETTSADNTAAVTATDTQTSRITVTPPILQN